ncbi:DUF370 domain-containing protein [Alicyclobacillus tolerans]|uniref:extracellular matrix regulator RemB n=1 Tax=Alicyclobacillus tolerans TaxID=90970 RepID=UPI001F2C7EF3|nr:extracellular matrix/biofilm biosynthesis regulator RemA family protein [Alicyclobacillus tolerans]MCF8565717.1 DUF370 domain-containing protein [Alicyclobacillus tolerans]
MFIHIGGDTMVHLEDVIGIFDIQSKSSPLTAQFLEQIKQQPAIEVVDPGEIKSFILTDKKLYYSPISSLTLKKRAQQQDLGN